MNQQAYINLLEYLITILLIIGGLPLLVTIGMFLALVFGWRPDNKIRWK